MGARRDILELANQTSPPVHGKCQWIQWAQTNLANLHAHLEMFDLCSAMFRRVFCHLNYVAL